MQRFVFVALALTTLSYSSARAQDVPDPWVAGVDYVAGMLDSHSVIGLGEIHQHEGYFAFVEALLASPEIRSRVSDVVVEFANARFQPTLDRYVLDLEEVPEAQVVLALREHAESPTGPWESPVYRRVIDLVRRLNMDMPRNDRLRLVAADLPIEWARIESREDYRALGGRSTHMGDIVVREVLNRGRSAVFIVGGAHLSRRPVSPATGAPRPNALSRIEEAHPGAVHVINAVVGFGPRTAEVVSQLAHVPNGSIVPLSDHFIGALPAPTPVLASSGQPAGEPRQAATRADLHDAYLWLGAEGGGKYVIPRSDTYPDDVEWEELNRRSVIRFGSCLDPESRFSGIIRPLRADDPSPSRTPATSCTPEDPSPPSGR